MESINWTFKPFGELTATELYRIIELRNRVFVVEQKCIYNDTDEKDMKCLHVCGWHNGDLLAYGRIVPPGISYAEPSVGRVVCDPSARGKGMGTELMKRTMDRCMADFGTKRIRISAQSYLIGFYNNLGFISTGKEYLEDDIPHTEMLFGN